VSWRQRKSLKIQTPGQKWDPFGSLFVIAKLVDHPAAHAEREESKILKYERLKL
jgi:hypothetical protein